MTRFEITGWSEGEAENAAATCFRDWMVEFGGGQREADNVLRQVKFFLKQHGDSRFEPLEKNDDLRPVNNRAGFWQIHEGEREFLVLPEVFREEICKGINYKQAAKVLKDVGWLKTGTEPGRNTKKSRLPGIGLTYCYVLGSSVWGDND